MRVLMISTDRGILEKNSAVRQRMAEYGSLVEELHIIVFSLRAKIPDSRFQIQVSPNTLVYPTNSWSRWLYIRDAIALGKKIFLSVLSVSSLQSPVSSWLLTCQDPFETGRVGLALKRRFGVSMHVQIHTDFLSPYFARQSFLNKIRVRMARKILAHADGIRVVSNRIKDSLLHVTRYTLRVTPLVLSLFVDQTRFTSVSAPNALDLHKKYPRFAFIVLMAARLAPEKNISCAFRVLKKVVEKYERTGLVIAGDGPLRAELTKEASRLGLSDNVVFEGHVSPEVLPAYYKTANAFLLTSDYEGYCMALIEAGLSGCPIVTSDVGVASDFFVNKESAFICPVGNDGCLGSGLLWLIEDVSRRASFADKAKEALSGRLYTKEEYMRLYREMWEECIARKI